MGPQDGKKRHFCHNQDGNQSARCLRRRGCDGLSGKAEIDCDWLRRSGHRRQQCGRLFASRIQRLPGTLEQSSEIDSKTLMKIEQRVQEHLQEWVSSKTRILCAISGGPDSVSLAHILKGLPYRVFL